MSWSMTTLINQIIVNQTKKNKCFCCNFPPSNHGKVITTVWVNYVPHFHQIDRELKLIPCLYLYRSLSSNPSFILRKKIYWLRKLYT